MPVSTESLPLFQHALGSASAFTPERLMAAVRSERGLAREAVPPLCVLDFDGDLSDRLAKEGVGSPWRSWACFHTSMRAMTAGGVSCGIVPRTIGGPYAVLVAEQLLSAGAKLIVGITSAGRVSKALPLPSVVVVEEAIRDEGTSLHYLPPSRTVVTPTAELVGLLAEELSRLPSRVRRGAVWTTDAPYRETPEQLDSWAEAGVLAVEMQAASLFAFGHARGARVAMVSLVSNAVEEGTLDFDTGGHRFKMDVLGAVARAAAVFLPSP
jgi:uridine phosphorylase